MKKLIITITAIIGIASFFSFTNNKPVTGTDSYWNSGSFVNDTVPRKKDSTRKKSGTTPYDSFGKPKKMDTARLK